MMMGPALATTLGTLRQAWGEERLTAYLAGLAALAGPLAETKASHTAELRIRIHQGRLAEVRIVEIRRIA
jgi:hypothetical protein